MHILHICNDFLGTTAHESLYKELDKLGVIQTIFVPQKKHLKKSKKSISFLTENSSIIYSSGLKRYHKYLYGLKIRRLVREIVQKVNVAEISIIHTPILSNEGAVAYELHKIYRIPYITAVRNTDVNDYFRVFKWRIPYFRKIAQSAAQIVFISSKYPERFMKALHIPDGVMNSKFSIIHNGVEDFFLTSRFVHDNNLNNPIRVVMSGAFGVNKNIDGLFYAIRQLRDKGLNIELSAIGNNLATNPLERDYANRICDLAHNNLWFKIYDAKPREQLLLLLRRYDIFALVSHHETFGLSYIEALSQGLPVIYTKGEGFDGTYKEGWVGFSADSKDTLSIANAVLNVIDHYSSLVANTKDLDLSDYSWSAIAQKYYKMYIGLLVD